MNKVTNATLKNFQRLNKDIETHKFTSRANKRDSARHICPVEYFTHKENQSVVDDIIETITPYIDKGIDATVDSLIYSYLSYLNLTNTGYTYLNEFISSLNIIPDFPDISWPKDERDVIGIIYQHLLTEGEKNKKGSYYTPTHIIDKLVTGEDFTDKTICDPCCGSGSFLLHLIRSGLVKPDNVYGYDVDVNASKITKMNLFILSPDVDYNKRIRNCDFLASEDITYDYFITNPPWGSMTDTSNYKYYKVKSGESYSYFIEKCLSNLGFGKLIFLLPISFLNVKAHVDIRSLIMINYSLDSIFYFGNCFKGVMTDVVGVKITNKQLRDTYSIIRDNNISTLNYDIIYNDPNLVIPIYDELSSKIIETIKSKGNHYLTDAEFALGIMTGNNSKFVFDEYSENLRPIFTGKEVMPIYMKPANKFIYYDRKSFQQVCEEKFFLAPSKLIYKFINKNLCFAVDKEFTLTLNSANILLTPEDFYISDIVLAAVLSSAPMNFYFRNAVNQIKILKGDIKRLPLPDVTPEYIEKLENVSSYSYINKVDKMKEIDNILYDFYNFTPEEIKIIEETVYK